MSARILLCSGRGPLNGAASMASAWASCSTGCRALFSLNAIPAMLSPRECPSFREGVANNGSQEMSVVVTHASVSAFAAEDPSDSRFFIAGKLRGAILEYVIVTRIVSTGERSTIASARYFDAMMSWFAQSGTVIDVISDEWSDTDSEFRSQLDRFNRDLLSGDSETDAAWKSFTGRMARLWGFASVTIVLALPPGAVGQYREVRVNFGR